MFLLDKINSFNNCDFMNVFDIFLLICVYVYVGLIFIISKKLLSNRPSLSRKFVHIMVGNMIFVMPLFNDPYIMVYFLTLPLTIATLLFTKYSPIDLNTSVTEAGHDFGLFYYAGIWTVLILIFPDKLWIVALAIVSMVYGDGFASLIGEKVGRIKYNLTGDEKSLEGSLTMFVVVSVMAVFVWMFYKSIGTQMPIFNFIPIIIISLIATFAEAITPKGMDNISVCSVTAIGYFILTLI